MLAVAVVVVDNDDDDDDDDGDDGHDYHDSEDKNSDDNFNCHRHTYITGRPSELFEAS